MQVPSWVKIFLGGKAKLLWFWPLPWIQISSFWIIFLFSPFWAFLLKPAVLEPEWNCSVYTGYREMLAERCFPLSAKPLRKHPASLLSLPCFSLPQALLSFGDTEPEIRPLTTPLSKEIGTSFWLFGLTELKTSSSPNMGLENNNTGFRTRCSGQELTAKLTALPSNYSFKENKALLL